MTSFVKVTNPVTNEELKLRQELYNTLTPSHFAKRCIDSWSDPVTLTYKAQEYQIQVNFCSDPFCRWFGQSQMEYSLLPYKPSRYKLKGTQDQKKIECNPDPTDAKTVPVFTGERTVIYSNWGIADEIARLIRNNSVVEVNPNYEFHKEWCTLFGSTPFDAPRNFTKNGKNKAKSQQWLCNECDTFTYVLPERHKRFTYHQKRDDAV